MNPELEKIKEKIAKLLRKSESAQEMNSTAEAMAFANKANDLLMQYNLKLADINKDAGLPVEPETIMVRMNLSQFGNIETNDGKEWMIQLLNIIYHNNLCKMVILKEGLLGNHNDTSIMIIGTEENVTNMSILAKQMVEVVLNICANEWKNYKGEIKRNKFRRDFLKSFPLGLHKNYLAKKQTQEVYALVRTNELAITNKLNEYFGDTRLKSYKTTKRDNNEASYMGFQAGRQFEINKELSHDTN